MTGEIDKNIREVSDWLFAEALIARDYPPLFHKFCERLVEAGVPILRCHMAMRTLHPMVEAIALNWYRGGESNIDTFPHGSEQSDGWLKSPLKTMLDRHDYEIRFRGDEMHANASRYPLFQDLLEIGATDYIGMCVTFADEEAPFENRDGLIGSLTTDQQGGFTDEQVTAIRRVFPRFALVAKLGNRERLLHNILDAYLGPDAGTRVREGQITLGSGQMIDAVIWFSDLRNSTPLAEKLGHEGFLALLNDYFAALAGAVMEHGGVVLRFIGDAALAIFPIAEDAFSESEARTNALAAARDAIQRASDCNASREAADEEPFEYGIGLHVGRIMYGNIGVPSRVEFSVIGPAANEAARIEALTKTLGESVIVSSAFVDGLDEPFRNLGPHELRGASEPVQLFGLTRS